MALPTGVYQRGAVFHIQIKVPSDLRTAWPSTFFVRKSLGTENRDEATAKAHRLWADATDAFARARARLKPLEFSSLTPAMSAYILGRVPHVILNEDDALRFNPGALLALLTSIETLPQRFFTASTDAPVSVPTPAYLLPSPDGSITTAQLGRLKQLQGHSVDDLAAAMSLGRLDAAREFAEAICSSMNVRVDWQAPAQRPALILILRAMLTAWIGAADRSEGKPVETPSSPEMPNDLTEPPKVPKGSKDPAKTLGDVLADWKAAKKPTQDSIERTERALRHFEASGQNVPLQTLKRTHGAAFRGWLLHDDRTFASKTALNYWQALTALLNVARDVGLIELNPWQGMSFEVTDSKKRKPFTDEDLRRLFGTTLHTRGYWPVVALVDHWDAYFCTLLLLWTGARVGELAQLEVADVYAENGLTVFSIHQEAEGSTVKGGSGSASVRTVPVPPDMMRLGFLDRVAQLRERGESKLFPTFHRPGAVTPGEIMSEWFRPFRATIGAATGALNGTHRFRHTVRTRLSALGIAEATADALTGHAAQGNAGRRIYTHVEPATVKAALERLTWPLDLPRIFTL